MKHTRFLGAALAAAMAAPLAAADLALVVVNSDYDRVEDLRGARFERFYKSALEDAGFRVFSGSDLSGPQMQRLAGDFAEAAGGDDGPHRLVIVLSGHLAGSASGGWLLGREVEAPNAFGVGGAALPLAPLAELAGSAPGQAVLMIADPDTEIETGQGLESGVAPLQVPQGVTVAEGPGSGLLELLREGLLVPGETYATAIEKAGRGVTLSGFVTPSTGLIPAGERRGPGIPSPGPLPPAVGPDTGEIAYWNATRDMGTIAGFRAYLDRYPDGNFAADARRLIEELEAEPERRAQATEAALELSRDQRRQIQRNLSLIGFDPRGIDGIFGPATRRAIGAWQQANGFETTTYLTGPQVREIQTAADRRAAELEEEARERREAEERADRAYWRDLGQGRDEAALRAYLRRYPDGLFAEVAQDRLDAIEEERRDEVRRDERVAWDEAQRVDNIAAYESFLSRFPQSAFADAAKARIAQLEEDDRNSEDVERARQAERAVAGNPVTRLLVERRLAQVGFDPGPVDGNFDEQSRRAIRRFQRDQGITVTGYVTQETMVRLLATR
ncbi:MAG: peptidoglycan-binding domain-containing protein [Pseudooceanicola sp.]